MIDYLKGRLLASGPGKAVVEVGGVGVSLETPPGREDLRSLLGEEVIFYTRLLIREEDVYLYGFRAMEERKLFNLVLGVSGFGPRLALALLGIFNVSQFYVAVLEENIPQLCRTPGVGRKAAQRLILELKEKLPKALSAEDLATGPAAQAEMSTMEDITEALCALGYSRGEASSAAARAAEQNKELSREELLKLALKDMAGSQTGR